MSETKKQTKRARRAPKAQVPVQVQILRITNPFNPKEFVREELTWRATKTLADYFPAPTTDVVVSINGKIVTRDQFGVTFLDKTDNLVICPVPTGGGGSKQILMIVALIAVSVMTVGTGAAIAGAMMGTDAIGFAAAYGAVGVGLANAAVTIAGSMLVHAIFAPSKPTNTNANNTSSSYGIDGAKNTAVEGIPVPVCYGQFRMAGNVLGLHTENDSDDNQILYMLLSAGEGPVASISDVQINDNPLSDYKDVEIETRLGLTHQTPIPWFAANMVAQNKNHKLSQSWFYTTTTTEVDKLRIDFVAPQGMCEIDTKDGKSKNHFVDLEIQSRRAGADDSAWAVLPVTSEISSWTAVEGSYADDSGNYYDTATGRAYRFNADGSINYLTEQPSIWKNIGGIIITDRLQKEYLANNPPIPVVNADGTVTLTNRVPEYNLLTRVESSKRSAVRRAFSSGRLDTGKYEIRVRRVQAKSTVDNILDEVYLADVNEITLDPMSYPHTALLGLKIKLGDQISGMPRVTFMNGGRMIQTHGRPMESSTSDQWFDSASQNPAWVVWDMLTHRRYGGAMPMARLDFEAFKSWATYCDAKNLKWNGPIDSEMNVWDASQLVLRVGHSQLVNVGTRYTIVTEKPADPVMMFSVANMIEGTFKETWLGTTDRANEIDVTFFDKTDDYKQRTVKIYDPAALAAGAKQRSSAVTLYGVTDYETAYKEGQFQLNLNRYILKTIGFSAPLEAVACSVGDLIYVQHDMTNWAVAGRFEAGSTASVVKLDRDVTLEAGKQYKLLVLQDAIKRCAGSVLSVVGTSVFLNGFTNDAPVKRIQVNGRDLRVAGVFESGSGSGYGVIVDDAAGITPGAAFSLWDTDVIEEYNVVNTPGAAGTVTLQTPMAHAPAQFVNWMFGEADKVKQPFRVKSITGSHEYRRDISAIEYKPEVYDFERYGANVPVVPAKDGIISPVTQLAVYEETYVAGSGVVSSIVASWAASAAGMYAGADVYVQKNDGALVKIDEVKNRTSATIDAAKGDKILVKIVAFDIFGKRSSFELAPQQSYAVIGEIQNINVGGVTGAGFTWAGRDCKISWRYNSVTHSYEFGSEPTGADAGALDPHFKDYEIRVYDKTHAVLRRTEYTTDNSFTYIYDKNFADGVTRHLVFEIRMRDTFNNLGSPATLDAYNPPPEVLSVANTATFESATISYTHSNDPDFSGVRIWLSDIGSDLAPAIPSDNFLVYAGPDSSVMLPKLLFAHDYYFKIAAVDAFGPTELLPTSVFHFKTTNMNVDAIADGALKDSQLIPALQSRINLIDAPDSIAGSVASRVLAEALARGTAITSLTNVVNAGDSQLASSINSVSAVANSASAAIVNESVARANAFGAEALARSQQIAQYDTNVRSYIQSYSYSKATSDAATNAVYSTIRSEFSAGDANTLSSSKAYVQSYGYTKAEANSVIASSTQQVTARLDSLGGSGVTVEQKFTSTANLVDGLRGQYSVKIDSSGYVSGFGLSSTPVNGAPSSEFIILADRFAVVTAAGSAHPFTIGLVNGVYRTIISSALIGDASINSAQIGTAQVGTLKIGANAVTVPAAVSGVGGASNISPGAVGIPVSGATVTVNYPQAVALNVLLTWQSMQQSSGSNSRMQVSMNGSIILDQSDSNIIDYHTSHVASAVVNVGAGTYTFALLAGNDWHMDPWTIGNWSVTILGVMR